MSIQFSQEYLKEDLRNLLLFFKEYNIEGDFDRYSDDDQSRDNEDLLVDEDTELTPWLPHSFYEVSHTISELYDMVYEARRSRKIDEYKFIGKRVALFHIDSQIQEIIHGLSLEIPTHTEIIDNQQYTLDIVEGLSSYGFKLIIDNNYNKYVPPVEDSDTFIEIRSEDNIDEQVLESLVEAYLFEVKSSLNVSIHLSPRVFYEAAEDHTEYETVPSRLRPLLRGKGIHPLLKLYNSTLSTTNEEILVLTYTKVIEYVSQTVIQQDLIKSVNKKLFSPRTLNPDANYILELSKIFEGNRNNQKDYYSIKLTIETCCDLIEITSIAPHFLKYTRKLTAGSKSAEMEKAYEEVANAISNTRNMFAHAKTNYEKKGKECPADQLNDFTKCLDILAQQIIRWFSKEDEDNRVT
ncbi:hypothetical protein [Halobacillus sp. A5]|uniref:hypothetical protein n=1 Tax=Halobacillus sp. A5 TaxID=2880263 RepID=UPI0020A66351|nr:hypothetical protein [Halobacillus sp. A5]MCP3027023.1 hypothetical protein [Halobacillus sp. A5]